MKRLRCSTYLRITVSLIFAVIANIVPLTPTLVVIYPLWLPLIIIYWVMVLPEYMNFTLIWSLGLIIDVLHGSSLGEHALGLCVTAFLSIWFRLQFRMFPLTQQIVFVFMLLLIYTGLLAWIERLLKLTVQLRWLWISVIMSALMWPLLQKLFRLKSIGMQP